MLVFATGCGSVSCQTCRRICPAVSWRSVVAWRSVRPPNAGSESAGAVEVVDEPSEFAAAAFAIGGTVGLGTLAFAVPIGTAVEASFGLLERLGRAHPSCVRVDLSDEPAY
jgi:hypothetical protein